MEYEPGGEYPPHMYLQQLARAHRFFDRYENARTRERSSLLDIEDYLWAFFQNCWHVKDWLRADPSVAGDRKTQVLAVAHRSPDLLVSADLANRSKHLSLRNPRVGALDAAIQLHPGTNGTVNTDHLIELPDGSRIAASVIGSRSLDAWSEILREHHLPSFRLRA